MKCLVTGGAGFIGSNLVEALLAGGSEVTLLDNFSTGLRSNLPEGEGGLSVIEGDVLDYELVSSCAAGAEAIFHLAAEVGNVRSLQNPVRDAQVNVVGTINVLRATISCGARNVVYSSSSAIFGEPRYLPIDEEHPLAPESFYAVSKLAAEKYCLAFARLHDISVACLRYFNVYGRRQGYSEYANVMPIFAERLLSGRPLTIYGDGEQTRDFVSVDDVVRANLLAAGKVLPKGEVFNIGTGVKTTVNALAGAIQKVAGTTVPCHYEAPRQGEVRDSVADISRAREILGFEPRTDLEQGVHAFLSWYRDNRPVTGGSGHGEGE